jgi:hypothetical protein
MRLETDASDPLAGDVVQAARADAIRTTPRVEGEMTKTFGIASLLLLCGAAQAQQVWMGLGHFFEKPNFADWTDPAYQDRITDNVWITRGDRRGIFNIATEPGYDDFVSPADTEWATGSAADWQSLTFQNWQDWHASDPPSTVGLDAVVHLISDDIYIDIRFESWTVGGFNGGGFSYLRAVPAPGGLGLLGVAGLGLTRRRR